MWSKIYLIPPLISHSIWYICRAMQCHKSTVERKRLLITLNILKLLKSHLCLSNYTVCEQWMLWSSFTLSFLHASECLFWTWSKITIADNHTVIKLHLSKTDPFHRRQSTHIYSTNSSTCPVCTLQLFAEKQVPHSPTHWFFLPEPSHHSLLRN